MSDKNKDLEGKENEDQDNGNDWGDDDNFGLPDIEYTPLDRDGSEEKSSADEEETTSPSTSPAEEKEEDSSSKEEEIVAQEEETKDDVTPEDYDIQYADDEGYVNDGSMATVEKKSSAGVIFTIVSLILVIALVAGYLFWFKPMQDKKEFDSLMTQGKAALEQKDFEAALGFFNQAQAIFPDDHSVDEAKALVVSAREAENKRLEAEKEAARLAAEEAERKRLEAEAAKNPKVGTVERITARTGRYFVVVASDIDGDLAMDFANRLAKDGVSSKIITPAERGKFHRITVADFDTAKEAQDHADSIKGTYRGAWIVKF